MKLPTVMRPYGLRYREFTPGLDLPSWFYYDIKSIDQKLHFVWHPYKFLWDDIINQWEGSIEDGRFNIHLEHGQECWGFVLTDGQGAPLLDQSWHIWRECWPYGFAHVVKIEARESDYLNLLSKRLYIQANFRDTYGDIAWNKKVRNDAEQAQEKALDAKQELFEAVQDENKWLLKKSMEEFARGKYKPTNPQKESIISYPGQPNRSKIIRPLEDEEGGLVGFN